MGMIEILARWARGQHQRHHAPQEVALRAGVLLVLVAALGLAACGGQAGANGGNQNCGTLHSAAGGMVTQGAVTSVNCFWQAYSHCQPATLQFSHMGVDTTDSHTLTIHPVNGGCQVNDSVSFFQASGNIHTTKSYQCSGMRQSAGGLVVEQCGAEGSVVIPAPNGTPAP